MLICWCFCGSFCTLSAAIDAMAPFAAAHEILPVLSEHAATLDTRFGKAEDFAARIEALTGKKPITTLPDAEPIGPRLRPDLTVVLPCTGNTLAKIRHGVSDGPVTLAVKSHLRRGAPLLLGLCSNDALGGNFENLAALSRRQGVYFLPLRQDDPAAKPYSCVSDFSALPDAVEAALRGQQLRPLFLPPKS